MPAKLNGGREVATNEQKKRIGSYTQIGERGTARGERRSAATSGSSRPPRTREVGCCPANNKKEVRGEGSRGPLWVTGKEQRGRGMQIRGGKDTCWVWVGKTGNRETSEFLKGGKAENRRGTGRGRGT